MATLSAAPVDIDPKSNALNGYRKKLMEHREMETRVKDCMSPYSLTNLRVACVGVVPRDGGQADVGVLGLCDRELTPYLVCC